MLGFLALVVDEQSRDIDDIQNTPSRSHRLPRRFASFVRNELKQVAEDLRRETIDAVSVTGGHLGAGLGVVELTVALHYVFDTPTGQA